MKRYLLSIYQPDGPPPADVDLEIVMANVDALIEETREVGAWVFNGGLHPPATATVLRPEGEDVLVTDGPTSRARSTSAGSSSSMHPISTPPSSGDARPLARSACRSRSVRSSTGTVGDA
jgi:hypothetical protein